MNVFFIFPLLSNQIHFVFVTSILFLGYDSTLGTPFVCINVNGLHCTFFLHHKRMHCSRNFSMIITCRRKKGVFFVGERMLVQLKHEQKNVLGSSLQLSIFTRNISWLSLPDKCKSFGRVMLTLGFSTGSSTQMIMEEANSKSTI
uniref:Uncharacterized protein n=1 Tax=Populus davidiana TaxID=266767 RepID=A0A6M2FCV8_9ROSI